MMRRAITAGYAPAVQTKFDVKILNADVVNKLIESSLQES